MTRSGVASNLSMLMKLAWKRTIGPSAKGRKRTSPNAVARHGNSLMGVNMRLADESDLDGVELRFPDGRAWPGEGDFVYVREALILGREAEGG
jgi:hypothetical protein